MRDILEAKRNAVAEHINELKVQIARETIKLELLDELIAENTPAEPVEVPTVY